MKYAKSLFVFAVVALGSFAIAADIYVDKETGVDSTAAGAGSAEAPYRTLQFAVDKSTTGGTIYVRPGVYDENKSCSPNSPATTTWGYARVAIVNKVLKLVSTAGPEKTFIKGQFDPASEYGGLGSNVVRCVQGYNCAGTVIEGFTLCDGATSEGVRGYCGSNGGAYQSDSDGGRTYFVNCIITNCIAQTAIARYATFVRCTFHDNNLGAPATSPSLITSCNAMDSVFYANSAYKNGDMIVGGTVVNCTIFGNYFSMQTTSSTKLYNSIALSGGTGNKCNVAFSADDGSVTNWTDYPVMSTAIPDLRVRKGAAAETMGDAKYRGAEYITLPAGVDRNFDRNGNEVASSGTIMAGALQEVATPAAGVLQFNGALYITNDAVNLGSWMSIRVDGGTTPMLVTPRVPAYIVPATYPVQYAVGIDLPQGVRPIRAYMSPGFSGVYSLFPEPDDTVLFTPPPGTDMIFTNSSWTAGPVVYADSSTVATPADGTEDHPYATLQSAIDKYYHVVVVAKPGTYSNDLHTVVPSGYSRSLNARLIFTNGCKRVIGEAGASNTFIVGAPDPDTLDEAVLPGCGTNAVRCAVFKAGHHQIQGFTLTGGYTHCKERGGSSCDIMGAAFFSGTWNVQVSDCIISNNMGQSCITHFSQLRRCLVTDNISLNGIVSQSAVISSIIGPNKADVAYMLNGGAYIYQSTVIGDGSVDFYSKGADFRRFNSIFIGGNKAYATGSKGGNIYHDMTSVENSDIDTFANPVLHDVEGLDLRPFTESSRALTAGVGIDAESAADSYAWWFVHTDFNGARLDLGAATHPAGAHQTPVNVAGLYLLSTESVAGAAAGLNEVPVSGLTISAVPGGRPASGLIVNGVTNLFEDMPGNVYQVNASDVTSGKWVDVIYTSDWYAAPDGDDTASGYYPAAAKSLQGALSAASSNDRVLALPGIYSTGVYTQDTVHVIGSRAIVPANVTLESMEGPAATIILGKTADVEDAEYYAGKSPHGMGWGAVRCVYLKDGAKIKGFTLSGGRTRGNDVNAPHGGGIHSDPDYNGAGVYSASTSCMAEDCFFTNCAAFRSGGTRRTYCLGCTFTDGYALYGGAATSDCRVRNCLSYGNTCAYPYVDGYEGFFFGESVDGCTALDSVGGLSGSTQKYFIRNTLVSGKLYVGSIAASNVSCCVFNESKLVGASAEWKAALEAGTLTNSAALALDANFRPIIGTTAGIDAGDPATEEVSEFDLGGGQRVYNGRRDIGAFEADWRPVYSADIRRSNRLSVTNAGPGVVESVAKTVQIPSGQRLVAELKTGVSSLRWQIRVRVEGTGTLLVTCGGVPLATITSSDGTALLPVTGASTGSSLVFAYSDGADGYAEILGADSLKGLLLRFF